MNRKQKVVMFGALSVIIISLIIWLAYGGEIFTKTQVLIEKKDPLFGWSEKEWINKFVWGLDLSLVISGIAVAVSSILFFVFRTKRKSSELS